MLARKPRGTIKAVKQIAANEDHGERHEADRIDYGPLAARLGYVMRRAQLAVFADFIATCSAFDIKPAQYSMLTVIERNPGLSQTKVAGALGIKKPNFVAMVDEFERRGFVSRVATPNDRRSYALYLTNEGRVLIRKLHKAASEHEARLIASVGPEMHRRMFGALAAIAELPHGEE